MKTTKKILSYMLVFPLYMVGYVTHKINNMQRVEGGMAPFEQWFMESSVRIECWADTEYLWKRIEDAPYNCRTNGTCAIRIQYERS